MAKDLNNSDNKRFDSLTGRGMDEKDIEKNRISALFAYLIFFIPLITCPGSRFGRYHANQSLLNTLLLLAILVIALCTFGYGAVLVIFPAVFFIIGIINVCRGKGLACGDKVLP